MSDFNKDKAREIWKEAVRKVVEKDYGKAKTQTASQVTEEMLTRQMSEGLRTLVRNMTYQPKEFQGGKVDRLVLLCSLLMARVSALHSLALTSLHVLQANGIDIEKATEEVGQALEEDSSVHRMKYDAAWGDFMEALRLLKIKGFLEMELDDAKDESCDASSVEKKTDP